MQFAAFPCHFFNMRPPSLQSSSMEMPALLFSHFAFVPLVFHWAGLDETAVLFCLFPSLLLTTKTFLPLLCLT
ncbi:unnamed protein product, partial [Linum tenue]